MSNQPAKRYVLFDRVTGRITATHAVYDAGMRGYRTPTVEEARDAFSGLLQGKNAEQLELIESDLPAGGSQVGYHVDVKRHVIVPNPQFRVHAARQQIQGDGIDSVEVQMSVVDEYNKVVKTVGGDWRVTTTRGRLSAPGGRIKAEHGHATITLTSTSETVDLVVVTVRDPSGQIAPGTLQIEFL
jgi:hypothetical protein